MNNNENHYNPQLRIGVLALQGDFEAHEKALQRAAHDMGLTIEVRAIRLPSQVDDLDGIILPGGESTTIGKLMKLYDLQGILQQKIREGLPIWGTCAGLILLASETDNALAGQPLLASMHTRVRRNAYGSQRESFETDLSVPILGEAPFHAFFIRGPAVESVGPGVQVLATLDDGTIVAVQEGNLLGTAFHPEVSGDSRFHQYFLRLCKDARASRRERHGVGKPVQQPALHDAGVMDDTTGTVRGFAGNHLLD